MSDPSPTMPPPNSDDQAVRFDLSMTLGPEQLEVLAKAIPAEDMVRELINTILNKPDLGALFAMSLVRTMNLPQNHKVKRVFREMVLEEPQPPS